MEDEAQFPREACEATVPPCLDDRLTLGERLADRVAAFGGSWTFLICFAVVLVAWVVLNSEVLAHWHRQFDPYPYILLNLFLSMLAAMQAPVIMMSQNRQAAKDRVQATHDYEINCRAELEIAGLYQKIDDLGAEQLHKAVARLERRLAARAAQADTRRGCGMAAHAQDAPQSTIP